MLPEVCFHPKSSPWNTYPFALPGTRVLFGLKERRSDAGRQQLHPLGLGFVKYAKKSVMPTRLPLPGCWDTK